MASTSISILQHISLEVFLLLFFAWIKLQLGWKHDSWNIFLFFMLLHYNATQKIVYNCLCVFSVKKEKSYLTAIGPKIKTNILTFLVFFFFFPDTCCAWNKTAPWEQIKNGLKWWKHTGSHTSCGYLILVQLADPHICIFNTVTSHKDISC